MARTDLTVQSATLDGLDPSFTAANADGHSIDNDGSAHTVTVVTPQTVRGLAVADAAVTIPAGEERIIGAFPQGSFGRTTDIDFDAVTSVTIAALRW